MYPELVAALFGFQMLVGSFWKYKRGKPFDEYFYDVQLFGLCVVIMHFGGGDYVFRPGRTVTFLRWDVAGGALLLALILSHLPELLGERYRRWLLLRSELFAQPNRICAPPTHDQAEQRGQRAVRSATRRAAVAGRVMIRTLLLAFIPLFVAMDVVAVVLIYLGIGMPLDEAARRRLVLEATMTAAAVGVGFLLVGDSIVQFLGVTVGDFQVAGGVLLLVLAVHDLLHPGLPLRPPDARPGVVPLGIPMIVGPAVLTTLLTLARTHGYAMTLIAFAPNLAIVWAALRWASFIGRVLGEAGCRAITKVLSVFLAAIGVTFARRGITSHLTP